MAFALAACAALSACGGGAPASYDLEAAIPPHVRAGKIRGVLVVNEPTATASYDSDRIVIRTGVDQLAYLAGAQWSDRLPRLVQTRLIETFENARLLKSVGRPGLTADNSLALDLRHFEIDVTTNQARVEIAARIVSDQTGRPIAAQVFSGSAPAPKTGDGVAAAALDQALREAMQRIVAWTAAKI